jgi:ribosomal protein S18 acetylase RimI-like enzyme
MPRSRSPSHPGPPGRDGAHLSIVEVQDGEDLQQARELLEEYFASLADYLAALGLDLAATRRQEVASLPGDYAPPGGRLLLARYGGEAAGCVTLRRLPAAPPVADRSAFSSSEPGSEPAVCELRRLYVRASYRGAGLGRHLTLAAIAAARAMSYHRVRLNTLPTMTRARALYAAMGFREIPPYRAVLVPGVIHFELRLAEPPATMSGA